jgi:hypothetical protein
VISKERWHRSNIYSAAPMPYMQRITWSGIALHAGVVPGHPASHGCIRLPKDFAIRLYQLTKRATRVIIVRDDVQPVEIANPHLFVSRPKTATISPDSAGAAGNSVITSAVHESPVAESETAGVASSRSGDTRRKIAPISVFVSGKLSRLFVRQRFTPLFDVAVKIQKPEVPLGTHVFTAMESQNDGASVRWTVVSLPEEYPSKSGAATKGRGAPFERISDAAASVPLPENANTALDRIEIPPDVVEQISDLVTPGSSFIVSDYGISRETGKDTDFVVLTH